MSQHIASRFAVEYERRISDRLENKSMNGTVSSLKHDVQKGCLMLYECFDDWRYNDLQSSKVLPNNDVVKIKKINFDNEIRYQLIYTRTHEGNDQEWFYSPDTQSLVEVSKRPTKYVWETFEVGDLGYIYQQVINNPDELIYE